jgi:hypothetical protein
MRLIGRKKKLDKGCERGRRAQEPGRYIGVQRATSFREPASPHGPRRELTDGRVTYQERCPP